MEILDNFENLSLEKKITMPAQAKVLALPIFDDESIDCPSEASDDPPAGLMAKINIFFPNKIVKQLIDYFNGPKKAKDIITQINIESFGLFNGSERPYITFLPDGTETPLRKTCREFAGSLINAIEKQIPKAPILQDEKTLIEYVPRGIKSKSYCPNCFYSVEIKAETGDYSYYCPHCGQRLDWSNQIR